MTYGRQAILGNDPGSRCRLSREHRLLEYLALPFNTPPPTMCSIIEPVAQAYAFRWGKLQEDPPECIDYLMTELTVALDEAEEAGNETRADRIDAVVGTLARGLADYKRQTEGGFQTAAFERAKAEIRAHQRRNESPREESDVFGDAVPRGRRTGEDRTLRVTPCRKSK